MSYRALYGELRSLRDQLRESVLQAPLASVDSQLRPSAENLVQYLALRAHDRRALQEQLASAGFSSLGRSESHVLAQVDAVLRLLAELTGEHVEASDAISASQGQALLFEHAKKLLGESPPRRRVRVMVTLPSEAASSPELAQGLIAAGMDLARINCAHDDRDAWRAMARNVREAARQAGRSCTIAVDLAGPKCRTGALEAGPEVIKLKPQRSAWGEVTRPASAWLTSGERARAPALPVRESFLDRLSVGDKLKLRDARGRARKFEVKTIVDGAAEIVCAQTTYVRHGTRIHGAGDVATIGHLVRPEQYIVLKPDDILELTRSAEPGHAARSNGQLQHACIPCEPAALLDMLRTGERVWLDDGRIGAVVEEVLPDRARVRVTHARPEGEKLRAGKGINLPDSQLTMPALTAEDHEALAFAVREADLVQLSFLRSPEDVLALQDALEQLHRPDMNVVLKIETCQGFARLPELLLAAMRRSVPGVMIARGDLAVECGFERLSEVQEEILWLCEAAHVPVIWATQVLETLAKHGRPTRAEITDAAMASRAECVMLNKGPYVTDAVRTLDDIMRRMDAHQDKKAAKFRALSVAQGFEQRLGSV